MPIIDLHAHAVEDLRKLRTANPSAAAAVVVALEQIEADPNCIDKLTSDRDDPAFGPVRLGIRQWQAAKRHGNLWRFRVFDTPATVYRVIYGYHYQTRQICILAVVHKEEFNYELDSAFGQRILADWRAI